MAYQAEQRSRLRAVFFSQRSPGLTPRSLLPPPTNTREPSGMTKRHLDREFLMRHCFVEQPSDLSDADISGIQQYSVRVYMYVYMCTHKVITLPYSSYNPAFTVSCNWLYSVYYVAVLYALITLLSASLYTVYYEAAFHYCTRSTSQKILLSLTISFT